MWRYREAIPLGSDKNIVSFGEGFTPMIPLNFKGLGVLAKLDFIFPTGSFKDRGSSVMMSRLREMNVNKIMDDSSGNAGASISAYAAKAGIPCEIFCPDYASGGKLTQITYYGAKLNMIAGTREDTEKAILEKAGKIFYASHNWNPYFLEGTKTLAFEIAEQLGWSSPDSIICPCGNGGVYLGLFIGFRELIEEGMVKKMPKLLGVQSSSCPPVYNAYMEKMDFVKGFTQTRKTIAEGICLAKPPRGKMILKAAKQSKGGFETVGESEVIRGLKFLSSQGIYVEPTSAVVIPAFEKFRRSGFIGKKGKTVLVLTGSGLKTTEILSLL
ncbi:MAG: pyridoxal-phosphate dependent enzyme [Candidatus Aenigmarchaeota archaeon]|nr:pyridoxal-phosphate dependent enzyme [Candidatus Aenigmarchaeota archaeon]